MTQISCCLFLSLVAAALMAVDYAQAGRITVYRDLQSLDQREKAMEQYNLYMLRVYKALTEKIINEFKRNPKHFDKNLALQGLDNILKSIQLINLDDKRKKNKFESHSFPKFCFFLLIQILGTKIVKAMAEEAKKLISNQNYNSIRKSLLLNGDVRAWEKTNGNSG